MRARLVLAAVSIVILLGGAAWRAAAADRDRGMVLYEARCVACHASGVHTRENRKARSFDDVREWVMRWNIYLGSDWGPSEVDDVSRYVNERYYGFPCPTDICSVGG